MPTKAEIRSRWYAKLKADPERWAEYKRKDNERAHRWYEANRDKAKEAGHKRYEANKEAAAASRRKYREANREQYLKRSREYYLENRETSLERSRQKRAANPEPRREYDRKRWITNPSRKEKARQYIERGKAIIARAKIGKSCECGEDNPAILEFHHIDPSQKLGAVGERVRGWSESRILAEIDKCVLRCVNCHRVHEWKNRDRNGTSKNVVANRLRKDKINGIKSEIGCRRCRNSDFRCLDFHHIDPYTKLFNVGAAIGKSVSMERLLAEIAKCEVLCGNCHRLEHLTLTRSDIKKTRQRIKAQIVELEKGL